MRGWGGFLAGCQLPAAALQHVNMSVARETGRAHTATRAQKPLSSFGFQTLGKNSGIRKSLGADGTDPNSDAVVSSERKPKPGCDGR